VITAEYEIVFNCNKTIDAVFPAEKFKQLAAPAVFLNDESVKFAEIVMYHGILLHASLKDDIEAQGEVKSLYCAANKFRSTFAQCSTLFKNTVSSVTACQCMPASCGADSRSL